MTDTLEIIDDLCRNYSMGDTMLNLRKCLTYIDEFEHRLSGSKRAISLVSFTALMEHYITIVERNWLVEVRNKYKFEKGNPIHFTKLRKIAQTVTFTKDGQDVTNEGWNDDYILYRANALIDLGEKAFKQNVKKKVQKEFVEEYRIWRLFRSESGTLDVEKLAGFYEDVLSVLRQAEFHILCTSVLYDTKATHKVKFASEQIKSPHVIAFSEHLNLLCFYLKHGFFSKEQINQKGSVYQGSFSTKLRWDGDDGFNQRHDYRLLFNKVITLGTTHYDSETVRKCLDEIRFVNKHEIGYYDNLEKQSLVSHVGCDIADFIAYYVGKYALKEEIIEKELTNGKTREEAEKIFIDSGRFTLGERVFSPYEEVIKDKIIITDKNIAIQKFNECHFYRL